MQEDLPMKNCEKIEDNQIKSAAKKGSAKITWLIMLCWLVYTCSYIGKLSYSANIRQIEDLFFLRHGESGTVSTFFFFAYGAGQIINGLLCKKYPLRYVVFGALILSSATNLAIPFITADTFFLMKFLWLLNGLALSVLWPSLIRLLSETLEKKDLDRAVVIMGTTVATGTLLVYGMSALFTALKIFKTTFFVAAALIPVISVVWLLAYPKLVQKPQKEEIHIPLAADVKEKKNPLAAGLVFFLGLMAFCAIVNNLVKDGLTTWTPEILGELYGIPGWTSILLTMLLPLLAIFGTVVATILHKKIKNFHTINGVLFGTSGLLIGVVLCFLSVSTVIIEIAVPVTVAAFAIVSCLMAGVNNVITSMVPLYMKEKVGNSGMLAGILNGFCYLGSTISSYGLGTVADHLGWKAVFILFLALCGAAMLVGFGYAIVHACMRKKNK